MDMEDIQLPFFEDQPAAAYVYGEAAYGGDESSVQFELSRTFDVQQDHQIANELSRAFDQLQAAAEEAEVENEPFNQFQAAEEQEAVILDNGKLNFQAFARRFHLLDFENTVMVSEFSPEQTEQFKEYKSLLPLKPPCSRCFGCETKYYDFNNGYLKQVRYRCITCNKRKFTYGAKPRKRRSPQSDCGARTARNTGFRDIRRARKRKQKCVM